jgi:hypothetical protein
MLYIVIQSQSYHTTRQISIAYSGLKQKRMHCNIQNFCDRNSVTHNKNQNDTSNVCHIQIKNSNVGLEHGPSTSMG